MTECVLEGNALCKVLIGWDYKIVSTYIRVNANYEPDWQEDAHCLHDEGGYEIYMDTAQVVFPDEYIEVLPDGTTKEVNGNREIKKLIEVISSDLDEVTI